MKIIKINISLNINDKKSIQFFASFLVDRTTKDRIDSKSSGKMITWWNFNPNKLEISREDIIENDDEKSVEKESLDFFGDENE